VTKTALIDDVKAFIIIVSIVCTAIAAVIGTVVERRRLQVYWGRVCTGTQWRRRFPSASKAEIHEFLAVFVEAFAFCQLRRLCFAPDDRVMDVYRALHPPDWSMADAMELEFFTMRVRKTYGVDIVPLWREDITLGDLFILTRRKTAEPFS
jgi:propanediol dehydratase small subunit